MSTRPHKPPMERAVHWPSHELGSAAGAGHLLMDAVLKRLRQPRRCDVERFLEVGPVQGIGLVEESEGGQLPSL